MSTLRVNSLLDLQGSPLDLSTNTVTTDGNPVSLADRAEGWDSSLADLASAQASEEISQRYNSLEFAASPYTTPGEDSRVLYPGGGLHRHFGGIARSLDGTVHVTYRRASEHATSAEGAIIYVQAPQEGKEFGAEVVLSASEVGIDKRDCSIYCTPTGRLVLHFCSLNADASGEVYFWYTYSDDNGATWTAAQQYDYTPYNFARTYGQVALIPDTDNVHGYRLVKPSYKQVSVSGYVTGLYYSDDDGATWVEGVPIKDDNVAGAENETAVMFFNRDVGIAVSRASGLNYSMTTDGGASWSTFVQPSWATDSAQVSPSLNKVIVDGTDYALLAWTNRTTDALEVSWAPLSEIDASGEAFASRLRSIDAGDLVNASGYQSFAVYPTGAALGVVFKEYLNPDTSSQVRLVRLRAGEWISSEAAAREGAWTPTLYGSSVAGSPVYAAQEGRYVKSGALVTAFLRVALINKGGASGQIRIAGLPFPVRSGPLYRGAVNVAFMDNYSAGAYQFFSGYAEPGTSAAYLIKLNGSGFTSLVFTDVQDTLSIYCTVTYMTSE